MDLFVLHYSALNSINFNQNFACLRFSEEVSSRSKDDYFLYLREMFFLSRFVNLFEILQTKPFFLFKTFKNKVHQAKKNKSQHVGFVSSSELINFLDFGCFGNYKPKPIF